MTNTSIFDVPISYFSQCATREKPTQKTIADVLDEIQHGTHRKQVELARKQRQLDVKNDVWETDTKTGLPTLQTPLYKAVKETIPAVTFHGTFDTLCQKCRDDDILYKQEETTFNAARMTKAKRVYKGKKLGFRRLCNITSASGFMGFEVDHISEGMETLEDIRARIQADPHTALAFPSLSEDGLYWAVLVPKTTDNNVFHKMFDYMVKYYQHALDIAIVIDNAVKDLTRLRILSFAPDLYRNETAVLMVFPPSLFEQPAQDTPPKKRDPRYATLAAALDVGAVFAALNIPQHYTDKGEYFQGECPDHDSAGGKCLTIYKKGDCYCFHCLKGSSDIIGTIARLKTCSQHEAAIWACNQFKPDRLSQFTREEPPHQAGAESTAEKPILYLGTPADIRNKTYPETLPKLAQDAWYIIAQKDAAQRFFCIDRTPVYVEDGVSCPLNVSHLESILNEYIQWRIVIPKSADREATFLFRSVPSDIPKHMINSQALRTLPLPRLQRIVHAPYFDAARHLHTSPGYSADCATLYYQNGAVFTLPTVPAPPTADDIRMAKEWLQDLLCDFPFVNYDAKKPWENSEKAHAIALLLEPFIRSWFSLTPLYVIEAATEGTGKTKLAQNLLFPALGKPLDISTAPARDEEWQKTITALLSELPMVVFFDNISHELNSQHFNAAITGETWKARKLGKNDETVTYPNRATWVATGNNPNLNKEMVRRAIRIRLEAKDEDPSERTDFRHPNLEQWAQDNRGNLIWAALTLIQNYLARGCPKMQQPVKKGGFEAWTEVMGGILEVNDIGGFLQNRQEFNVSNTGSSDDLKPVIQDWIKGDYANEPVLASDLYRRLFFESSTDTYGKEQIAPRTDPPIILNGHTDADKCRRFGTLLGKNKGRVFAVDVNGSACNYRLNATTGSHNRTLWNLEQVGAKENGVVSRLIKG